MKYELITALERRDLIDKGDDIVVSVWPEFMMNDAIANKYFFRLYDVFPRYQYWLLADDTIVGIGNAIPLRWDQDLEKLPETGWDWALEKGFKDHTQKLQPNLLCGLSITVNPLFQGRGVSTEMIRSMKKMTGDNGFKSLIIPARPTLKKDHPLMNMKEYLSWKRDDGLAFDPWIRIHVRNEGKIVKICSRAMKISGSVAEWEAWTGMKFPKTGEYIIAGALNPVKFENDHGIYIEPNVWIEHSII